jgi:hypothetical protein
MTYFKNSTENNNIQPLSVNTLDINLQQPQTFLYYNKTKHQTKQSKLYILKPDQLSSINNVVSISTSISDSKIKSSNEK